MNLSIWKCLWVDVSDVLSENSAQLFMTFSSRQLLSKTWKYPRNKSWNFKAKNVTLNSAKNYLSPSPAVPREPCHLGHAGFPKSPWSICDFSLVPIRSLYLFLFFNTSRSWYSYSIVAVVKYLQKARLWSMISLLGIVDGNSLIRDHWWKFLE